MRRGRSNFAPHAFVPLRLSQPLLAPLACVLWMPCLLLLSSFSFAATSSLPSLSSYANSISLHPTYNLYWTADTSASPAKVSFAVHAQTKGYVAFGISEVGGMVGTDAMVGWVTGGKTFVTDRFIFSRQTKGQGVRLDKQQDWVAVGGEESVNGSTGETWTTIHFWRNLDTGDCNDRPILNGRLIQTVWSYGPYDTLSFHGTHRGAQPLMIIPPANAPAAAAPVVPEKYINFTYGGINVPSNVTSYVCKRFTASFPQKLHATWYGPVLDGTDINAVHHLALFSCTPGEWAALPSDTWSCLNNENVCTNVIAAWAVGGKPFQLPPDVGIPLETSYSYFMMQMHYTNPSRSTTIIDNSGISLGVTTQLQANEAAITTTGPVFEQFLIRVPAMRAGWTQTATCSDACTRKALAQPIYIFSGLIHMHTLGKQLVTKVYRNGQEIITLGRQDYYDFNYQQTTEMRPPIEVLPGDSIKTTCIWDSSKKLKTTWGGPGTPQEMCIHYMFYYPKSAGSMQTCFDICLKLTRPIPKVLPDGLPLIAPRGVQGTPVHVCGTDYIMGSNNETCKGTGYGENRPQPRPFGCKPRTLCSTCDNVVKISSI